MKIPHPFPYQGSKRNLAPLILPYIPKDCETFYELFAGSAAMAISVAAHRLAKKYVINDINEPLARLWKKIISDPEGLAISYEKVWRKQFDCNTDYFKQIRSQFNRSHLEEHLLFLLARCVKAAVRYNSKGEFNQGADPRRKGMLPATMRGNILATSALLRHRTKIFSVDYATLFSKAGPLDVIYLDPPYQGVCQKRDSRYSSTIAHQGFIEVLSKMNAAKLSYIISYDGRTGDKTYGEPLPENLNLTLVEIDAGRSSQATLLGRDDVTIESLYISQPLMRRLGGKSAIAPVEALLV